MTPDSTPIVGATRFDNLYLNTGHGTLGWTLLLLLLGLGVNRRLVGLLRRLLPHLIESLLRLLR